MILAMNCVAPLFITMCLAYAAQAGGMSNVHLVVAKHVLMNDDIHGQCASGEWWPRIVIIRKSGCNFKIEQQQRVVEQGSNTFYYTDFVVKNVTATCKYMCAIKHLRDMKTVVVTDAIILPTPLNINTFEDTPVKLKCSVKTNVQSKYKLIWMKGDVFVTGIGYSIESTEFDNNTNTHNHFLIIHRARPGAYTCMLISTSRKEIDTKIQHVVTESNSTIPLLLKHLTQFFKWN